MNCNKCGTPILPGENTCRFCGTVGDFSERKKCEPKPEIIGFDIDETKEYVNFMIGEDDLSINDDKVEQPLNIDFIMDEKPVVIEETKVETPITYNEPRMVNPVSYTEEKIETSIPYEEPQYIEPMTVEGVKEIDEIKEPTIVVNSIIEEPKTARIPVEEVKELLEKEEKIEEPVIEPVAPTIQEPIEDLNKKEETEVIETKQEEVKEEEVKEEITEEVKEDKKGNKSAKGKAKNNLIITLVLIILLATSIFLNCFLLMGKPETNEPKPKEEVSKTTLTTIYENYQIELPNNWKTSNYSKDYLFIYDASEDWALSLNFSSDIDFTKIKDNINNITSSFENNKYLFTSDYTKTVNNKDFYIFKGKYYSYTVYIIMNKIDEKTVAITDLKFTGEVDENILNSTLESLSTISYKDITPFLADNFDFQDLKNIVTNTIKKENK